MDSDEEFDETPAYRGVPATIILINIFDPSNERIYEKCHLATCRLIRQYLRESLSQYVGVCLFGAEDTDASKLGSKSVIEIFPLSLTTLDDYKKLQDINIPGIKQENDLTMSEALLHCSKMFANCKKQLSTRTIIILSKLDHPPAVTDQKHTLKKVVDLVDANVDLKLINVSDSVYSPDPFYQNFLIEANKGSEVDVPKPIWSEVDIERSMYKQAHRHLAVAKLNFELGNGFNIGVGVYSLLKSQTYQKSTNLDRETSETVTTVTKTIKVSCEDNSNLMEVDGEEPTRKAVPLLKSEIIYSQSFGGEKVDFSHHEMKVLRNPFGPPMLKLLGFKPASLLSKEKWFLKKGYFLFPNESIIEGSTIAFKAMYQACVETGMIAICVLCTRVNSRPFNVALSPSKNPLGLDIDIGFDVICIPYAENVRDIGFNDENENIDISDAHKTVMDDVIKSLRFDYNPEMFENPKLQSQYHTIEAIALKKDDVDPIIDTTKPSSEKFANLNDDLFMEIFGPFGAETTKRQTTARGEASGSKKIKAELEVIDEDLLEDRLANDKVKQYTVVELKQILRSRDIPDLEALTGCKKAQLVDLVYKYFK